MPKILFAGGGTGGHIYPALAMAQQLVSRRAGFVPVFVGRAGGPEEKIVPGAGFELFTLKVSGLARFRSLSNFLFPLRLLRALWGARRLLNQLRPMVVVGTGGYVSFPVLFWAQWKRVPNIVQEQNSVPGLVTRLLAPRANVVFLGFPESGEYFSRLENLLFTGNPVRKDLVKSREEGAKIYGLASNKKTIFVFGGSQGARKLNEAVRNWISSGNLGDVQIIWQTGPKWFAENQSALTQKLSGVVVLPYIDDMAAAYAASDLVVCRAGALSIAELTTLGKPSILIPYELAAADHQTKNAEAVAKAGGALVLKEAELADLPEKIANLLNNASELKKMAARAKAFAKPEAARQMVDEILKLAFPVKPFSTELEEAPTKGVTC
ncbi:MAG: undecaprenyldiphospho-muramoylpentapeptide beta-N-acetylglucosaminyltransferase [candidate division Zixibacteria bacterium]|nr:undecaprenyldiphospho-muramoylpentapeptide beta-N-acetylglucosaminyltransferase [candidate division Zixibacteria bacterium]MCI0595374.1 undecaprenyldiphospho-muramoylpentapeptide beta-N-acetylglucosaminyltransferase [candidate division Zixibacteria bacterium]